MGVLQARGINAGYGDLAVLHDISITLSEGEILSVIGPNGAGKTTLLRSLIGAIKPTQGSITFRGEDITRTSTHDRITDGLSLVPEEQNLFTSMTVRENLKLGSYPARDDVEERMDTVFELFPRLAERAGQRARTLSGGEAQMLAIGRSLMTDPDVLLLDEPSLGLAPKLIPEVFEKIETINDTGVSTIIVEQQVGQALSIADTAYLLESGEITMQDEADAILDNDDFIENYLGGK